LTDAREKRKHQRASVNWPVVVVTPQRYLGGKARNISLGGAALIFNRDPGSHELLRLAIKIPTGNELVQTTGIVVWSKLKVQPKDLYGCQTGIRFTSFMGKSRQYLDEAISECLGLK
jgi:hypothetical protein